ncbi:Putative two-component system sensor kinase [plant metagenome]|uniref:Signal transduction histidine-protein kinase/phosphatase MprB n=1 Tax=plant metagenome TaxID=1297885 RepID=A0A484RC54_9ZZZZ
MFWRSFLAFWLGMAAIVAVGVALTASVAWQRVTSLDGLSPANLMQDASQLARLEGETGLRRWVQAMDRRYSALRIYLVRENGQDLLGHDIPLRVRDLLDSTPESYASDALRGMAYYAAPSSADAVRLSWWEPQSVVLPSGESVRVVFQPYDASQWDALGAWQVLVALIAIALVVTAPLCWLLARAVNKPVQGIQHAARLLAAGRLDARTPAALSGRGDALGQLSRDFDAMAERMQDFVQAHEALLRNVAHELRSPLARLQLSVELARRKDGTLDLQLDRIAREGERLDELVGNTLRLARLGGMTLPVDAVDLSEIVDQVVENGRFEASARGVRIAWHAADAVPMRGDHASLESAVENILRNAIRHSRQDGLVQVSLSADADRARVEILDAGPGVPEAELARIFQPFYRVRSAVPTGGGAGLGLSIVQACARAHGGEVLAANAGGQDGQGGLRVSLVLPRRLACEGGASGRDGFAAPHQLAAEAEQPVVGQLQMVQRDTP